MVRSFSDASVCITVMTCVIFSLYVVQRSSNAFGHQIAVLDTKLNSLHATLDFQHQITTARFEGDNEQLEKIHSALVELLKHQAASPDEPYST